MSLPSNFVSIHPYFKAHPGKLPAIKAAFPAFIEKTASEAKNLFYGFTINSDEIFCREGYAGAEGVLAHLENVGALLAEELDKLKEPLAHLKPAWFVAEESFYGS